MKYCKACKTTKPLSEFYFSGGRYRHPCKKCNREKRLTLNGIISQRWNGILGRVSGKTSHHCTGAGKPHCAKKEFYRWAKKSDKLNILYANWVKNDYNRNLSPSIDRVNINKGYVLNNMQWLTMHDNNKKGHEDHSYTYGRKKVRLIKDEKEMIFDSGKKASLYFGKNQHAVANNIRMGHKLQGWKCEWI